MARAAAEVTDAPVEQRMSAVTRLGIVSGERGEWHQAAEAFERAIELLPQLAPRHHAQSAQLRELARFASLAPSAAACAVRAGDAERAVELLEQGRGVLLGQALDTKDEVSELRARRPDLAETFLDLRDRMSDTRQEMRERRAALPGWLHWSGAEELADSRYR
ncbi:hypothetical protein [Sphaerisporangium perillae]|uniref:hypothetical protein n=1 Tax=Sphaerisporangium perillae TaxID=2935860 RepID=UPI00200D87B2|nr:hypothetical protein [Sphaerisporangium perillae]